MTQEQIPYYQASRYPNKQAAGKAYTQAQEVLRREVDCDLSTYRFLTQSGWHVLVIGEKPDDRIHLELEALLTTGTLVTLPFDMLLPFLLRRQEQIQIAPWVEHHYLEDD
jgi:hypothetical protein